MIIPLFFLYLSGLSRVGMLLFGPAPGFEEISSEKDATIWMLTSSLSSLSQLANTTTSLDGYVTSPHHVRTFSIN